MIEIKKKAGRKNKYDTHVKPYLENIKDWYEFMNEEQIAKKLGISFQTFWKYKNEHKELSNIINNVRNDLSIELKSILKKRAKGFYYTDTKTYIKDDGERQIKIIEEHKKYALPDVGAIHLLLKNIDDNWHNDDVKTLKLKEKQVDLQERKLEQDEWEICD